MGTGRINKCRAAHCSDIQLVTETHSRRSAKTFPCQLLRGHVGGLPGDLGRLRFISLRDRETEIRNADASATVELCSPA
jgi:hypothetical protein